MLPAQVAGAVDQFIAALRRTAPDQLAGVYAAGGLALADFSARQSNIDLVVVCDPPLDEQQQVLVRASHRLLGHGHRQPEVWYTSWPEVAGEPRTNAPLETPMTRALLRNEALALFGPDWPVVWYDPDAYRAWCEGQLRRLVEGPKGLLVLRRAVTPMVLQACRLAQGAVTGKVFSKSTAGETVGPLVPAHFRRILTDAVGYRRGAQTSMYWGPFERKYDALVLLRELLEAVSAKGHAVDGL
jgi:hypothetical protein